MKTAPSSADKRAREASAVQSFGAVLKFTLIYGLVAVALLAGQASLTPDPDADASSELRVAALGIAG